MRRRFVAAGLVALVAAVGAGVEAAAQLLPGGEQDGGATPTSDSTTTTTASPDSTTTTTAPVPDVTLVPSTTAPPAEGTTTTTTPPAAAPGAVQGPAAAPDPGEGDAGADGGVAPVGAVPAAAQAIIDSIARTAANDNHALVEGAAALQAAGVAHDDAVRAVFGRFPVLGPTRWSDDWYFPRWTGTQFRFHQGLDMFAEYGTPVAAPVDGVARIGSNPLGGLTVKVVEPDGTYWYLAHLSGIAAGLVDGQAVTTGQVVGFVGDSGNARGGAPHVHFGVYPVGGAAVPPKPVIDSWVAEGAARVPELLAQLGAAPTLSSSPGGAALRARGTEVGPPTAASPSRGELLWASSANPTGGAVQVADAAAAAAGERLDWTRRAAEQRAIDLAWTRSSDRARAILGPLTNPVLRQVVEGLRVTGPSSPTGS